MVLSSFFQVVTVGLWEVYL